MKSTSAPYSRLLHVKQVIKQLKAIRESMTLTERERYAVEECLAQAYDRAAALFADLGERYPGSIPLCLLASSTITVTFRKAILLVSMPYPRTATRSVC
jgi:hypothetical protein